MNLWCNRAYVYGMVDAGTEQSEISQGFEFFETDILPLNGGAPVNEIPP